MTGAAAPERIFRRSRSSRLTSLAAFLLFGCAAALRAAAGELGAGFAVVVALALLCAAGMAGAWGDWIAFDADGVRAGNRVWQALGRAPRRISWSQVAGLRDHRRAAPTGEGRLAAVFIVPHRGRPFPLDALDDLDGARALAQAYLDAARRS